MVVALESLTPNLPPTVGGREGRKSCVAIDSKMERDGVLVLADNICILPRAFIGYTPEP